MLFGDEKIRQRILQEIATCEKEKGFRVIYGAMVGGISKGLQYCDSDYDTRFLYINDDFPRNIIIPRDVEENKIIYRKYFDSEPFEWIPFWEFSSFLQFLVDPSIDHKFSNGLYNVVGWTFMSPYNYDPYGLQNKILPLIQNIFYKDYCIVYHKNLLNSFNLENENIVAKDYLYALHAALSINWMMKFNEYPPIYMPTLLSAEPKLIKEVEKLMQTAQREAREHALKAEKNVLHDSHYKIFTQHNVIIDDFIQCIKDITQKSNYGVLTEKEQDELRRKVNRIYEIVINTIECEEKVKKVNL